MHFLFYIVRRRPHNMRGRHKFFYFIFSVLLYTPWITTCHIFFLLFLWNTQSLKFTIKKNTRDISQLCQITWHMVLSTKPWLIGFKFWICDRGLTRRIRYISYASNICIFYFILCGAAHTIWEGGIKKLFSLRERGFGFSISLSHKKKNEMYIHSKFR